MKRDCVRLTLCLVLASGVIPIFSCNNRAVEPEPHYSLPWFSQFPGLPREIEEEGPSLARRASGFEDITIDGENYSDASPGVNVLPAGLRISAPSGYLCWAIYQVPGLDIERYVTSVDLEETAVTGSYWVLAANYDLGRWELVRESQQLSETFANPDIGGCLSPGGNFYFALVASGSTIVHSQAVVHIQNNALNDLPAPTGLGASSGSGEAALSWDSYTAAGATALNIYQSPAADMSGASLVGSEPLPGDNQFLVGGLSNGSTYYFALKATDGIVESAYSNIASASPIAPGSFELGGLWGRLGNDAAGTGRTALPGPVDFSLQGGVDLTGNKAAGPCRTSPAIDADGNVYALSRDGVFSSWSGDLASQRFSIDLATIGARGAQRIPPQAPCLDSQGNAYFASVDEDSGDLVFWGFTKDGAKVFDVDQVGGFGAGGDNDLPFPSLNLSDQCLVSAAEHYQCPLALDQDGQVAWKINDYKGMLEFSAEPVYNSATASFEWPITFVGISIDPRRHWMSLDALDGSFTADHKAMGGIPNVFGGIALAGGMHYYAESSRLVLLDSATGSELSSVDLGIDNSSGSPALDATGQYIYQPVYQDEGFVILGKLQCYKIGPSDPPQLQYTFSQAFDFPPLTGKPAVDSGNNVYFADEQGEIYRLSFNPSLPVEPGNPSFISTKIAPADTYKYNSFALNYNSAYICTEQNRLYVIGNPFLD